MGSGVRMCYFQTLLDKSIGKDKFYEMVCWRKVEMIKNQTFMNNVWTFLNEAEGQNYSLRLGKMLKKESKK